MKLKDIILQENKVASAINNALISVDPDLHYKDFAIGVAEVLKDEYGPHNIRPFLEVLTSALKINEQETSKPEIEIATTYPGNRLYSIRLNGEKQRGKDHFKAIEMIKNITGIEMKPGAAFNADKIVNVLKDKGYRAYSVEMDVT